MNILARLYVQRWYMSQPSSEGIEGCQAKQAGCGACQLSHIATAPENLYYEGEKARAMIG